MCNITHADAWHLSPRFSVWMGLMLRMLYVGRDSFKWGWWLGCSMWDITYLCVTWLIDMWHDSLAWDMTHPYVTWLILESPGCWMYRYMCVGTPHSWVTYLIHTWHASFICDVTHTQISRLLDAALDARWDPSLESAAVGADGGADGKDEDVAFLWQIFARLLGWLPLTATTVCLFVCM